MIPVTQTFLPPLQEYENILKRAWEKKWITNRGELVLELEEKLKEYLGINNIIVTNNGTIPIQIAIKALGIQGEIITTPFSYVATTAAIVWENCKPVFVDIHPEYLTIDETKIEEAITEQTQGILATHVFGNPCNIENIEKIAKKHNLSVIYDAAHCFGVTYKGESVFNFGDVSTCSFHATKLFHTGEGGAIFSNKAELKHKLYYTHNFGHNGPLDFFGLGINAKISELQAAMGLAVLPYIDKLINSRKEAGDYYNHRLGETDLQLLKIREGTEWNYSYFPVIFPDEKLLLKTEKAMKENKIIPRRYFYPSLNSLNYLEYREMPLAESVSRRILCLPLFAFMREEQLENVVDVLLDEIS